MLFLFFSAICEWGGWVLKSAENSVLKFSLIYLCKIIDNYFKTSSKIIKSSKGVFGRFLIDTFNKYNMYVTCDIACDIVTLYLMC